MGYAARLVRRPANDDYPFGMGAVEPLVIAVKGLVIAVVCILSLVSAVVSLVQGEQRQWLMDSALSAAVMIGFGAAWLLERSHWAELAVYADPVMMLVISVYFMTVPVKMVLESVRELLLAAPKEDALEDIHETL